MRAGIERTLLAQKVDPTLAGYIEANSHYWQVYFGTNKAIVDVCSEASYAVPETRHALRQLGV